MKFSMIALALMSSAVFASETPQPVSYVLSWSSTAGFVRPEYQKNTYCEVYPDHVVITKQAGALTLRTGHSFTVEGDVLGTLLKASQGKVTEKPAPTDGPILSYQGRIKYSDGSEVTVELNSEGSRVIENDSPFAATLVNFISMNCQ